MEQEDRERTRGRANLLIFINGPPARHVIACEGSQPYCRQQNSSTFSMSAAS